MRGKRYNEKAREGAETPADPLWRFPRFLSRALYLYFILPAFPLADLSLLFSPAIPHIFVRLFRSPNFTFSPSVFKSFAKHRQENTEDFASFDDKTWLLHFFLINKFCRLFWGFSAFFLACQSVSPRVEFFVLQISLFPARFHDLCKIPSGKY